MSTPKISIIIPVYNSVKTIDKCLKSIFAQTFKDFEVIVVNDGSTDKSMLLLRRYGSKIKLLSQKNKGAPAARNFGFKKSQGSYIIFCDSDVVMKLDMLEKMHRALEEKKDAVYVYSSFKFGFKKFKLFPYDFNKLKEMPYIHSTSLVKREAYPGWDESLKKFQDWDFWLKVGENGGKGYWIDEVLFKVKTGGTMSNWLPKFLYKLPWLGSVKKYNEAREIIKKKHQI